MRYAIVLAAKSKLKESWCLEYLLEDLLMMRQYEASSRRSSYITSPPTHNHQVTPSNSPLHANINSQSLLQGESGSRDYN